jgi:hypothetical protein
MVPEALVLDDSDVRLFNGLVLIGRHTVFRHPTATFPENRENNREFFKNLPLVFYLFGLLVSNV